MRAPQQISEALMEFAGGSSVALILIILAFLIVFGLVMEPLAVILITTPIFFPMMMSVGMNPVHFGVIMIFASAIGFVTPPVGMSLFVASSVTGLPILSIAKKTVQFLILLAIVMMAVVFIPEISLALVPAR